MANWFDDNAPDNGDDLGPPSGPQPAPPQPPPSGAPGNQFAWQQTPLGIEKMQGLRAWMAQVLGRDVSEQEAWSHLNYPQMPDLNFLSQIKTNIANQAKTPPTAPGGTPAGGGGQPGTGATVSSFWASLGEWKASHPGGTAGDLDGFVQQWNSDHPDFQIQQHGGNIGLPNGEWWDEVNSYGDGGKGWQHYARTGGGEDNNLLDPWTGEFKYPGFEPPPAFKAPTLEEAMADPNFKGVLERGQQAMQRSAAAKGTILTTGLLKDLGDWTQDTVGQQYGNYYGRKFGEYESAYGHSTNDYDRDRANALNDYLLSRENFWQNQDRPFSKLLGMAGIGSGATGQYLTAGNNFGSNYTNMLGGNAASLSDYYATLANINSAANMGRMNNWNNAFSQIGNAWLPAAYASMWGGRSRMAMPGSWMPYGS